MNNVSSYNIGSLCNVHIRSIFQHDSYCLANYQHPMVLVSLQCPAAVVGLCGDGLQGHMGSQNQVLKSRHCGVPGLGTTRSCGMDTKHPRLHNSTNSTNSSYFFHQELHYKPHSRQQQLAAKVPGERNTAGRP